MDDALRTVIGKLDGARKSGGQWMARCPAHEDNRASLSITEGKEQPVVFNCHAGCDSTAILNALELTWKDLCQPREDEGSRDMREQASVSAVYPYHDENGTLLYEVVRKRGKKFLQRVPDPTSNDGYRWGLGDTRRVLFHLPKLLEDISNGTDVWIVEGEKDVLALERAGVTATCNSGGAGKWRDEYSEIFRDQIVHIVADRDEPGQRHARQVYASLRNVAGAVEIVEAAGEGMPDGRQIKDASDHLEAGYTTADFVVTHTERDAPVDLAPDLHEFLAVDDPPYDWLIPNVLERGDRLIWTGTEGTGKSVTVRMLAVALAAGLHPFDRATIKPQRVLFVDCENGERKTRKHFRGLEKIARVKGRRVPDGNLRIICRPEGIDLLSEDGAAWLLERVTAHKPDLLCVGPFYRLHHADMNDERAARLATVVLDNARAKVDCAVITEHHAPHGEGPVRSVRPVGSSLLMRWPELGIGIRPAANAIRAESGHYMTVDVVQWRGARDDDYRWPEQLTWGTHEYDWPWVDAKTRFRVVTNNEEGTSA
jgi:5S rRNA maturation endonuclease (ribonuclease M5)